MVLREFCFTWNLGGAADDATGFCSAGVLQRRASLKFGGRKKFQNLTNQGSMLLTLPEVDKGEVELGHLHLKA